MLHFSVKLIFSSQFITNFSLPSHLALLPSTSLVSSPSKMPGGSDCHRQNCQPGPSHHHSNLCSHCCLLTGLPTDRGALVSYGPCSHKESNTTGATQPALTHFCLCLSLVVYSKACNLRDIFKCKSCPVTAQLKPLVAFPCT